MVLGAVVAWYVMSPIAVSAPIGIRRAVTSKKVCEFAFSCLRWARLCYDSYMRNEDFITAAAGIAIGAGSAAVLIACVLIARALLGV